MSNYEKIRKHSLIKFVKQRVIKHKEKLKVCSQNYICICSYGFSGETKVYDYLVKNLKNKNITYNIYLVYDRYPPDRLTKLHKFKTDNCKRIIGSFSDEYIPYDELNLYTVLYIYHSPVNMILKNKNILK